MERWLGRVAMVTGASVGIGAGVCEALVKSGMKVVGVARRVDKIQELEESLKNEKGSLTAVKCDLTKDEDIYSLFEFIKSRFGGVDVCINNAGLTFDKSLLDGTPDEWRQMMNVNFVSLCLSTKLSVLSMRERGVDDGHIINISSTAGHRVARYPEARFYSGTKYAVRAITEGLRQELREAKSHIRVTAVSPGAVETEFLYNMVPGGDPEKVKGLYRTLECLQADDIAAIILHVLSAPPHVEINDIIVRPTEQQD